MTPPLLEKSRQSMLVAKELIQSRNFASVVNRAYYSCLQHILHILIEKLGHTREELKRQPSTGTHGKAQYLLEMNLVRKVGGDKTDYKWFQDKFPTLKQERVLADYFEEIINADRGYDAIRLSEEIITTLNKYYK